MSDLFYSRLPESRGLAAMLGGGRMEPAPDDAWLACADVRGSTRAIAEGRYKDVNLAGAACITAALNACDRADLPFVFGGDGAVILAGAEHKAAVARSLAGTLRMTRTALGLEMRAGLVQVRALRAAGADLRIGRVRMSDGFHQAAFAGGGAALAESWLKGGDPRAELVAEAVADGDADFGGLECRWRGIRPTRGRIATLIVEPRDKGEAGRAVLSRILLEIESALGPAIARRPVSEDNLRLTLEPSELSGEARVVSRTASPTLWQQLKVAAETAAGMAVMAFRVRWPGVRWGRYKADVAANTDFEKFDDALRMVVAIGEDEIARMRTRLDAASAAGLVWYGLELSEECRITCLVLVRGREHFHFVDGAGGGYAAAATALKAAKAGHSR